jgi:hypothetical protein
VASPSLFSPRTGVQANKVAVEPTSGPLELGDMKMTSASKSMRAPTVKSLGRSNDALGMSQVGMSPN